MTLASHSLCIRWAEKWFCIFCNKCHKNGKINTWSKSLHCPSRGVGPFNHFKPFRLDTILVPLSCKMRKWKQFKRHARLLFGWCHRPASGSKMKSSQPSTRRIIHWRISTSSSCKFYSMIVIGFHSNWLKIGGDKHLFSLKRFQWYW